MSLRFPRKPLALALAVAGLLFGVACGGGDDETEALREELAALREQVSTTTTTVPVSTTTEAPTTTTTVPPTTTTKPAPPTTQRVTPTTQPPAPTTTAPPPTTTTTLELKEPQGTVTWLIKDMRPTTNNCVAFTYTVFNRSDTALKEVKFSNVYNQEGYPGPNGTTLYRWGNPVSFPEQTVAAGIAPYGQGDVSLSWCPTSITPGSTSQFPMHIDEETARTAMRWRWFSADTNSPLPGCCAWWDKSTKTGHE